jgi:hypothetical protein
MTAFAALLRADIRGDAQRRLQRTGFEYSV